MSRVSALLTIVLLAGTISLSVLSPDIALAQCALANRCRPNVCSDLQRRVHPTCDQPRSCTPIHENNKPELRRRLAINQRCLNAREAVARCFSNPDPGHQEAIQSVENAIVTCETKIDD